MGPLTRIVTLLICLGEVAYERRSREETDSDPDSAPLHPALRQVRCGDEDDLTDSEEAQKRWAQAENYAADLRKASSASPPKMRAKFTTRCFKMLVVRSLHLSAPCVITPDCFPNKGESQLFWDANLEL